MHLSDQELIVILVVGPIAGWLAGKVVRSNGFGLVGDAAIGFGDLPSPTRSRIAIPSLS
jgi:F0F1-type ATP synthase assembly protein I